jgi:hypothetical protein
MLYDMLGKEFSQKLKVVSRGGVVLSLCLINVKSSSIPPVMREFIHFIKLVYSDPLIH